MVCSKCLQDKDITNFRVDKTRNSGVKQPCKQCDNERGRQRQATRREREGYPEYINQKVKEWRLRNPEKYAAQVKAQINRRKIKKSACENCGAKERLHMHHPDYSKPIDVVTLCVNCHEKVHHG